ncbi:MAG: hypothetical protein WDN28_33265 [Chthoniobacter sp.]
MESGAVIRTDPQMSGAGSVKINANGSNQQTATILGSIIAPGGNHLR